MMISENFYHFAALHVFCSVMVSKTPRQEINSAQDCYVRKVTLHASDGNQEHNFPDYLGPCIEIRIGIILYLRLGSCVSVV